VRTTLRPDGGGIVTTDGARVSGGWRRAVAANKVPIIFGAVCLVLATALASAVWWTQRDSADHAKVGDCLWETVDDKAADYRIAACGSNQTKYKVLARYKEGGSGWCGDVAGASRQVDIDGGRLCVAEKDVDPATAVNGAREGDCILLDGDASQRLDCADAKATHKVLKRLTNVSDFQMRTSGPCKEVPGTQTSYAWDWRDASGKQTAVDSLSVDVVLCLGKK
jgi:hypothetical protein